MFKKIKLLLKNNMSIRISQSIVMSEIYCINYIGYTVNDELTSNSESYSEFE